MDQFDLGAEWYFHTEGLLGFTYFEKDFSSLIGQETVILQRNQASTGGGEVLQAVEFNQPVNTGDGKVKGFEVTAQTSLFFVPGELQNAGVIFNYTDLDSRTNVETAAGAQELGEPYWFDVETPVAEAVGEVDVLTLNHHGNRDATNANFLRTLRPRVIVQQSWISNHPGGEVLQRMISKNLYPGPRDLFATNMLEETKVAIGPWLTNAYKSMQGHILVRVEPSGDRYYMFILDDTREALSVSNRHGPYRAR